MTIPPPSRNDPGAGQLVALIGRATDLLGSADPRAREAAAEIAGLLDGAVAAVTLAPLAGDPSASVRGAVAWALGQLPDLGEAEAALLSRSTATTIPPCASAPPPALLRVGTVAALSRAIAFCAGDGDPSVRAELRRGDRRAAP